MSERLSRDEKREVSRAHADEVEAIGARLMAIPADDFAALSIEPQIAEAVTAMHAMRQDGARRRQGRFVLKRMRKLDAEDLQQLNEAVSDYEAGRAQGDAAFHEAERWRERLIREGDEGIEAFLAEHDADRQQLRQLVLQAQRAEKAGKPLKSSRGLFRALSAALSHARE
ncbi:DUF615 domain-containing protein [Myxococcota bacterium]|nr:DUF615 domain-containing protein [Myxococcota bacterium]